MPTQAIEPGAWVARFVNKDHPEIARVKYVRPADGRGQGIQLDLVLYSISGERLCKGPPPLGETESYAQAVPATGWELIAKPDFELLPLAMQKARMLSMMRLHAQAHD